MSADLRPDPSALALTRMAFVGAVVFAGFYLVASLVIAAFG